MRYLNTTVKLVWDQGIPEEDGEYLVTVKKPDGSKTVEIRRYDADEQFFPHLGWHEYIAYARVVESDVDYKKAKAKGMAFKIKWRTDYYPEESGNYLGLLSGVDPEGGLVCLRYDGGEEEFAGYFREDLFAWAKIPKPCISNETLVYDFIEEGNLDTMLLLIEYNRQADWVDAAIKECTHPFHFDRS